MSQSLTPIQRTFFVVFLFALFPACNVLNPRLDEDTWWHLAVGQWVVEHREAPSVDPFSRIGQEQQIPWMAYSWLHEVALFETYQIGGLAGVIVFRHVLGSLMYFTAAWFVLRRSGGSPIALLALALVTMAVVPLLLERPWHYTIIFTILCLHATLEWRSGVSPRRIWWLILVFALWANLHIQFVLGIGILGLGLCTALFERYIQGKPIDPKPWCLLIAACTLATLINPYHAKLYVVVWEYATQTGALRLVNELAPPRFGPGTWWNWALIALLAWSGVEVIRRRLPIFELALLAVAVFLSLRMQRDIWFGAIVSAAIITRGRPTSTSPSPLPLFLAVIAAAALARIVWQSMPGDDRSAMVVNDQKYPAGAVEYLRRERPPGPLFNHFNWGGYLIWALPEYPVGFDGRTNLYGDERLLSAFNTWEGDGELDDPELLAANVILVPAKIKFVPLREKLRAAPDRWRIVYEDQVSIVFVPIR